MPSIQERPAPPRWLAMLLLVPMLVVAAVFGFFIFLVALGFVLFAAVVIGLRLWWLRRKLRAATPATDPALEGEYVVVREPPASLRRDDHE
jgi:hypothetical protein